MKRLLGCAWLLGLCALLWAGYSYWFRAREREAWENLSRGGWKEKREAARWLCRARPRDGASWLAENFWKKPELVHEVLGTAGARAIRALVDIAQDETRAPNVRAAACQLFASAAEGWAGFREILVRLVSDRERAVREAAGCAFACAIQANDPAVEALAELVRSPDARVRSRVGRALYRVGYAGRWTKEVEAAIAEGIQRSLEYPGDAVATAGEILAADRRDELYRIALARLVSALESPGWCTFAAAMCLELPGTVLERERALALGAAKVIARNRPEEWLEEGGVCGIVRRLAQLGSAASLVTPWICKAVESADDARIRRCYQMALREAGADTGAFVPLSGRQGLALAAETFDLLFGVVCTEAELTAESGPARLVASAKGVGEPGSSAPAGPAQSALVRARGGRVRVKAAAAEDPGAPGYLRVNLNSEDGLAKFSWVLPWRVSAPGRLSLEVSRAQRDGARVDFVLTPVPTTSEGSGELSTQRSGPEAGALALRSGYVISASLER